MRKRRRLKVVYKNLPTVWGYGHVYPLQLCKKLKGKKHLEILLHESLHHLHPEWTEDAVKDEAIILCNTMWGEGYRRVDNSNDIPMQDGTK